MAGYGYWHRAESGVVQGISEALSTRARVTAAAFVLLHPGGVQRKISPDSGTSLQRLCFAPHPWPSLANAGERRA